MKERNSKIQFPTNEICKRGFARHLQSLLLGNIFDNPKSKEVINGLLDLLDEQEINYEDNGLFTESLFERWWDGKGFPGKTNKCTINLVLNGLTDHWFNRTNYQHRFQLYLASRDLSYIHHRNNKIGEKESNNILNCILDNWTPMKIGTDQFDLCIFGSSSRSGYKHQKNDIRKYEKYDLNINGSSYVGFDIPGYIANIYQAEHKLSVIPYMFCLLCLNLDNNKTGFKLDLFFDLLSALNCANVLLPHLYSSGMFGQDKVEKQILAISSRISDIFFTKYNLPSEIKNRLDKHDSSGDKDIIRSLLLKNHRINDIPGILESILNDALTESNKLDLINRSCGIENDHFPVELSNIFEINLYDLMITDDLCKHLIYKNEKSNLSKITTNSVKIFSDFINFYYGYINFLTGLKPEEIIDSLNSPTDRANYKTDPIGIPCSTDRFPLK